VWMFMIAVGNVQGNSVTGVVSVMAFLAIYFLILNGIIQSAFNLVEEISDDVIGWVGHAGKSQVGRGMDDKVGQRIESGVKGSRADAAYVSAGEAPKGGG